MQLTDEILEIYNSGDANSEELLLMKSNRGILKLAMDRMPDNYKLVLLMRDYEEMNYTEIAAIMQCPIGTVRSRISRARNIIKQYINIANKNEKMEMH